MKITKQDKEMLADEFRKVWRKRDGEIDEKMVKYCVNKTSAYLVIDGAIVTFDKPNIQTRFCYGYGIQIQTDYEDAGKMADYARRDFGYFIERNMDGTDAAWQMEYIQEDCHPCEPWLDPSHYTSQTDDCKLGAVRWEHWDKRDWCERQGWRRLTDDELAAYYAVLYEEQVKFLKRLKTYLKRYGLSKVETWTYWADE
jgi:hypothetical protein